MAADIYHFTVTIPAGTPASAPLVTNIAMPPRTVRRIDWKVPPGHMGTMSFLIAMGKVPVLPVSGQAVYVTADGKDGSWELTEYPDSGAWQAIGYNTGTYPHAVLLTFYTDLPSKPAELLPLLSPYDLMPAPDLSHAGPPVKTRR